MALFLVAGELLLMSLLGFAACKTHVVGEDFGEALSRFLIDVIVPCYVFRAICLQENLPGMLREGGKTILAAVVTLGLLFLIGTAVFRLLKRSSRGRILRFGTMFSNALLFGIPLAEAYWGETGLLYLMLFYIPIRLGYYCLPDVLLSPQPPGGRRDMGRRLWHAAMAPSVLACFAGLACAYAGVRLPEVCMNAIGSVGGCCKPLGMMLIGIIVAGYEWNSICSPGSVLMALYKLLLLPTMALLLLRLLGVGGLIGRIIVLYTALPCGPLLTTFCIKYDPDHRAQLDSAGLVILSTVGAVVTVSWWLWVMERILPA
ncbi:Predicted permease [Oscillibacter sp. PC13]|uniref:AEC family transporter n=1 Tax=Oscillibacter sp. PC13 TaxID=1855299 RepID=UPI0008E2D0D0|nr:AEC family transporter [Oscillibacter sp. PC13]SFP50106.1 Predicted permease [Oscillibacter sp. PC13]